MSLGHKVFQAVIWVFQVSWSPVRLLLLFAMLLPSPHCFAWVCPMIYHLLSCLIRIMAFLASKFHSMSTVLDTASSPLLILIGLLENWSLTEWEAQWGCNGGVPSNPFISVHSPDSMTSCPILYSKVWNLLFTFNMFAIPYSMLDIHNTDLCFEFIQQC